MGALPGTGWALKGEGGSLSSMSCWQAGENAESGVAGRSLGFPEPEVSTSESCDRGPGQVIHSL